jgi:simple sugar transport system permease protein
MTYSYGGSITENMVLPGGDMAEGTIPAAFSLLGQVPTIVIIMLVVTILAQLGLSLTTHGRRMYAIGGNPEAARLSGIRTTRYKVAAYVIASLLAGTRRHFAGLAHWLVAGECRWRVSDGCGGGRVDRFLAGRLR